VMFPDDDLSSNTQAVSNMGGGLVSVFGLIELTVEVCGLMLKHPFFYYDNPVFLMGIDLFTRAALMIDCASRCVWSKRTLRCHERQDLANATAKPSLHVHADKSLDMVPSLPILSPDVETRESSDDHVDETALTQLSMPLECPLLETSLVSNLVLDETQTTGTSARLSPRLPSMLEFSATNLRLCSCWMTLLCLQFVLVLVIPVCCLLVRSLVQFSLP